MAQHEFTATLVGTHEDDSALVATLAADESGTAYVSFQRSPWIGSEDDWGIYVEFDDQVNAGYNCIECCEMLGDVLTVRLSEPIDREKRFAAVRVAVTPRRGDIDLFVSMLRRIFTGHESLLKVNGPS